MAAISVSDNISTYTPRNICQMREYSRNQSGTINVPHDYLRNNTIKLKLRVSPTVLESIHLMIRNRLMEICNLKDNWDGYGAIQPKNTTIRQVISTLSCLDLKVLQFLEDEDIIPTPYGTIVVDLYRGSNRLSIEFGESKIGFFSELVNGLNTESEGVNYDRTKLPNELQKAIELFLQA